MHALGVLPCVPRSVQTDDFSAGKRLHWSENSGAFMDGSRRAVAAAMARARHDMRVRVPSSCTHLNQTQMGQ